MDVQIQFELFKPAAEDFKNFLDQIGNDRILISGKFGSGKTTFLKEFFKEPNEIGVDGKKYEVFRISPVHYSISGNEDIIELIKYDILTEFLVKGIEIYTSDFPSYNLLSYQDIKSILASSLSMVEFKGINLGKIIDELKKLKENLDLKKEALDEGDIFSKFLEEIESQKNIYQRDIVTKTIEHVIRKIKEDEAKETILIIDDLDRIDPEHVFRILNVFSAHFDDEIYSKKGLKNKFGFDKVIVVCDYNNIKSIFESRYGVKADFSGYINKFYSKTVFHFSIKQLVANYFTDQLFKMDKTFINNHSMSIRYFGRNEIFLENTLTYSLLYGSLPLRTINKLRDQNTDNEYSKLDEIFYRISRRTSLYNLALLKLNLFLFDGVDQFVETMKRLFEMDIDIDIDSDFVKLVYTAEKAVRVGRGGSDSSIVFQTSSRLYLFRSAEGEPHNDKQDEPVKIIPATTSSDKSLSKSDLSNIITAFGNRIKQLSGIS